jgi:glucuronate isomerase
MSDALRQRLLAELDSVVLIDPHTHINPHRPAAETLADILGYHYYTELAHSAGMPRSAIEPAEDRDPRETVRRLVEHLGPLRNTVQYSWLLDLSRHFFGFSDDHLTVDNWQTLYDAALERMGRPTWSEEVLRASNLEAVFLTNEFDDPLTGWDTRVYIPCLRTDDLVFKLHEARIRDRLAAFTGESVDDLASLRAALGRIFDHFVAHGARACAISLPPDFSPTHVATDAPTRRSRRCVGPSGNRTNGIGVRWPISCSGRWPSCATPIDFRSI